MYEATARVSADDDTEAEPPATSGSRKSSMEANHCKFFENVPAAGERRTTGMMRYYYSKRHESSFRKKGKEDALPPMEKHQPHPTTDCRDSSSLLPCNNLKHISDGSGWLEHINKGCFYEINHTKLPPRAPVQLKSVPAVMVTEKTELNVTVKFPSVLSLRTYFTNVHHVHSDQIELSNWFTTRNGREKMHPELDEQFVMGLKLAEEVLVRQILSSDFAKQKHLWLLPPPPLSVPRAASHGTGVSSTPSASPVLVMPSSSQKLSSSSTGSKIIRRYDSNLMRRRGNCWSELVNSTGLLHWGTRRRVAFLGSQKNNNDNRNNTPVLVPRAHHHQSSLMNLAVSEEEEEEEEEDEEEEENEAEDEEEMEEEKEEVEEEEEVMEEVEEQVEEEAEVMGRKMDDDDNEEEEEEMENGDYRIIKTTTAITTTDYQSRRRSSRRKRRCLAQNLNQMVLLNRSRATNRSSSAITSKKRKRESDDQQKQSSGGSKALAAQKKPQLKIKVTSYDRWSKERYKTAEIKMLQIMKERGAIFGKPMLRRTLRAEARKHIGDTGLLDHLLKHTAGKVTPDGKDRFRRRHNADGEMEYWLEDAELVNIRKEAGVKDPFWTPPPGWMPGDNPSQDPICARDIRNLKLEMSNLKKYVEQKLEAQKQQHKEGGGDGDGGGDHQALILHGSATSIPAVVAVSSMDKLDQFHNATTMSVDGALQLKEGYKYLMKRKEQLEQQLNVISISLNEYQEQILRVTSRRGREEPDEERQTRVSTEKSSVLTAVTKETNMQKQLQINKEKINKLGGGVGENHQSGKKDGNDQLEGDHQKAGKSGDDDEDKVENGGVKETKSEKRQRLSGFRICKPQGTFLWPNSSNCSSSPPTLLSPHGLQQQYHLQSVDPTLLSVSPSTSSTPPKQQHHQFLLPLQMQNQKQHHQPIKLPSSPVKPLAERRAVSVKTMITSSSAMNLNVLPLVVPDHVPEDNISSIASSSSPLIKYHHRHHHHQFTNNNSELCCGTPTSAPPHHQQPPRTLLLLPHVSCGKGGDDHHQKEEEEGEAAVMRCSGRTNTTGRTELMMSQIHYQRKQKQHQQQLLHQLQEQEEMMKKQGGDHEHNNHKYRQFISLL